MERPDAAQEPDAETTGRIREVTQAAVTTTATAFAADASIDIEERLRSELAAGGLDIDDDEWLAEVAQTIRAGHSVQFVDPNGPGSLGGDNGGG